jgi:hypothetical protein
MTRTKEILAMLAAVAVLVLGSQDLRAQRIEKPLPPAVTNLEQAQLIEIRNDAGATILKGTFETKDRSGEIDRKAKLSGISGTGSAEIEVSKKNGQVKDQELELELKRLLYGAPYKIFVDNKEVYTFSADHKGQANLKLSSKITK